ncbi:MAG: hypothetical protein GX153_02460 [Clostridiaceae bacterium]|nr:hypothetical protein [Clostridiaceae bacterium]
MVLGIPDFWIWSVFLLCIASAALCVVYGVTHWNRGANDEGEQLREEAEWLEKEAEIEEKL